MEENVENGKYVVWGDHIVELACEEDNLVVRRECLKITRIYPPATKKEKAQDWDKVLETLIKKVKEG